VDHSIGGFGPLEENEPHIITVFTESGQSTFAADLAEDFEAAPFFHIIVIYACFTSHRAVVMLNQLMSNQTKQVKMAIINDDRDCLTGLIGGGVEVDFEHIGLARRLNRQQILSILLADAKPTGLDEYSSSWLYN
jgi:hypothetical protein